MPGYNIESPGAAFSNTLEDFMVRQKTEQRQALLDRLAQQREADQHAYQMAVLKEKKDEAQAKAGEKAASDHLKAVMNLRKGDFATADMIENEQKYPTGLLNDPTKGIRVFAQQFPKGSEPRVGLEKQLVPVTATGTPQDRAAADRLAEQAKENEAKLKQKAEEDAAKAKEASERDAQRREEAEARLQRAREHDELMAAIAAANRTSREGIADKNREARAALKGKVEKLSPAQLAVFKKEITDRTSGVTHLFMGEEEKLDAYQQAYEKALSVGGPATPAASPDVQSALDVLRQRGGRGGRP